MLMTAALMAPGKGLCLQWAAVVSVVWGSVAGPHLAQPRNWPHDLGLANQVAPISASTVVGLRDGHLTSRANQNPSLRFAGWTQERGGLSSFGSHAIMIKTAIFAITEETLAGEKVVNMHETEAGRSTSREGQLWHCLSPVDSHVLENHPSCLNHFRPRVLKLV